jgi:hypothetical protein
MPIKYLPFAKVPKDDWQYVREEMISASKKNCKHCHGRAITGRQTIDQPRSGMQAGDPIYCRCAQVNMEMVEGVKANPQAAKLLDFVRGEMAKAKHVLAGGTIKETRKPVAKPKLKVAK